MSQIGRIPHKDKEPQNYSLIIQKAQKQQSNRSEREAELSSILQKIKYSNNVEEIATLIKEYCVMIVGLNEEEMFINHFVQVKFLQILQRRIKEFKSNSLLIRNSFSLFQFLLKSLKKYENLVYFLVKLNQLGFVAQKYQFRDEEDIAYYANFLKLMIRKINEDTKLLAVFLSIKQPHFPLLLNLLKFYDSPDPIMHTSSKLAIMQISKNNSPLIQSYTLNFPFVIFYPFYVGQIQANLKKAMEQTNNNLILQQMENSLRYMQDFIVDKEKAVIDMYTNTFLKMMGNRIYSQLISITDKNKAKGIKLLKIITNNIIGSISAVKIKVCLMMMLSSSITTKMKKCFQSPIDQSQINCWLIDQCKQQIVSHCQAIFFNQSANRSLLKRVSSYIPHSHDNRLYYQINKLSQFIGSPIVLNQSINHDQYLPDSYLQAEDSICNDEYQQNELHQAIFQSKDEEILYYYVKLLGHLIGYQHKVVVKYNLTPLITQASICCSLGLVQAFYSLVVQNKLEDSSQTTSLIFQKSTDNLVYFIMTNGWPKFISKLKQTKLQPNQQKFNLDIFRQIQCDLLLFVALRTLLGVDNSQCQKINFTQWDLKTSITNKISYNCRQYHRYGEQLIFTFFAQNTLFQDQMHNFATFNSTNPTSLSSTSQEINQTAGESHSQSNHIYAPIFYKKQPIAKN